MGINDIGDNKIPHSVTFNTNIFDFDRNSKYIAASLETPDSIAMTPHVSDVDDATEFRQSAKMIMNPLQLEAEYDFDVSDGDEVVTEDLSMTYNNYDNEDNKYDDDDDMSDEPLPVLSKRQIPMPSEWLKEEEYKTEEDEGLEEDDEEDDDDDDDDDDTDDTDDTDDFVLEGNQTTEEELMDQILTAKQERKRKSLERRILKDNKAFFTCKCNQDDDKAFCVIL